VGGAPVIWYLRYTAYREIQLEVSAMDEKKRQQEALFAALD
jgi:hypothetical protein